MFTVTYRGVVYPWHCDHMGHMNVMWYTGKFDEATWGLLAELGMTSAALVAAGRCRSPRKAAPRTGARPSPAPA